MMLLLIPITIAFLESKITFFTINIVTPKNLGPNLLPQKTRPYVLQKQLIFLARCWCMTMPKE